ncbi:MAG: RNA polymerase sigma factor [Burkholderiales bacterium]|nr:RNA polymerase sigma factor [Burkholderiales bacterium]
MMFFAPQRRARALSPDEASQDDDGPVAQLLQRLVRGELEALDGLYRRESGRVYRYALALCGNTAWAADATQEAFVALATRPQGFDPARGQIGAYLAGVARHALAARWRELRREEPLAEVDEAAPAAEATTGASSAAADAHDGEGAASPETLLVRTQELQALWAALRALPMVFREAVVLVDLQERPYAEAAQIAGIELNTLRTRLHRARVRLAALLGAGA